MPGPLHTKATPAKGHFCVFFGLFDPHLTTLRDWVPKNTPRKGILVLSALDRLLPNRKALWQQKKFVQWGIQTLKYPFKLRQAQKAQNHLQHFLAKQSKPISYASQIVPTPWKTMPPILRLLPNSLKKLHQQSLSLLLEFILPYQQ